MQSISASAQVIGAGGGIAVSGGAAQRRVSAYDHRRLSDIDFCAKSNMMEKNYLNKGGIKVIHGTVDLERWKGVGELHGVRR